MTISKYMPLMALALITTGCSVFGIRSGYETVQYEVLSERGEVQIRQYPSRVVAETISRDGRNDAFRALFRYITGDNISGSEIAMTSPVEVKEGLSQEVDMTTPVEIVEEGESVMMRFFLPKKFTLETAPKPADSSVVLKELDGETVAVLTYSGSSSEQKFKAMEERLRASLKESGWQSQGKEASFMGYDPPFTLPSLRRNEVALPVKKES